MLTQDLIESIITTALNGLCTTCSVAEMCTHRKGTDKVIIQCELFDPCGEVPSITAAVPLKGLCTNCSQVPYCHLQKAQSGVWHCEAYEEL